MLAVVGANPARADAGAGVQPYVVGGDAADPGTFPWLAFIASGADGGDVRACTGTVVSSNLVLTAAHCVVDAESGESNDPGDYRVVTGNVDWTGHPRKVSTVSQIHVFPLYRLSGALTGWGDAALLHLFSPIDVPPVQVADSELWEAGTAAIIAGWGRTEYDQEGLTSRLHWTYTFVQSDRYCLASAPGFLLGGHICAIQADHFEGGACHGDSGGPLLTINPERQEPILIGVTKGVYGECRTDLPNVFTRSDLIAKWVTRLVQLLEPPSPVQPPPPAPTPPPAQSGPPQSPSTPEIGSNEPLFLGHSLAVLLVPGVLRRAFKPHSGNRWGYRIRCRQPAWFSRNRQRCEVSWRKRGRIYKGVVVLSARRAGGRPKVRARVAIRWVHQRCGGGMRLRGTCRPRTARRAVETPMNRR